MVSTSHLTPDGKVSLIDMGGEGEDPKVVDMAANDASHALATDPDRWRLPAAFTPPPATVEQRLALVERRLEELDGYEKKRAELIAAEHKRIISEQVAPAPAKEPEVAVLTPELQPAQPAPPLFGPAAPPAEQN